MLRSLFFGSFLYLFLLLTAAANPPNVAVDIAPVHSLVTQVMAGVGKPDLIIQPGASPHGYSLRPSEAAALQRSDVVFYVGTALTPWLESPLENLAGTANKVELLEISRITLHEFREGATFEAHDHHDNEHGHHDEHAHKDEHGHHDDHGHKDEHGHHDEHAHKDEHGHHDKHAHKDEHGHDDKHAHKDEHGHDEHGHKDEHGHDEKHAHKDEHGHDDKHAHKDEHDHKEEHGHHDGHHHGEHDPHAWLDPENAKIWLNAIAAELSSIDSANASAYQRNAAAAIAELDALITSIRGQTKQLHDIKFIVFHDAYQYFERRFDVEAIGAISLGDASDPSPSRVKEIRDTVAELGVRCVYTEPQFNPGMVRSVFENTQVTTIGVMDPLGADIKIGEDHYSNLLKALLASLNQCR